MKVLVPRIVPLISFFFLIERVYPYAQNEHLLRCRLHNIHYNDCINSVYRHGDSYERFLHSFNLPIEKEPMCNLVPCRIFMMGSGQERSLGVARSAPNALCSCLLGAPCPCDYPTYSLPIASSSPPATAPETAREMATSTVTKIEMVPEKALATPAHVDQVAPYNPTVPPSPLSLSISPTLSGPSPSSIPVMGHVITIPFSTYKLTITSTTTLLMTTTRDVYLVNTSDRYITETSTKHETNTVTKNVTETLNRTVTETVSDYIVRTKFSVSYSLKYLTKSITKTVFVGSKPTVASTSIESSIPTPISLSTTAPSMQLLPGPANPSPAAKTAAGEAQEAQSPGHGGGERCREMSRGLSLQKRRKGKIPICDVNCVDPSSSLKGLCLVGKKSLCVERCNRFVSGKGGKKGHKIIKRVIVRKAEDKAEKVRAGGEKGMPESKSSSGEPVHTIYVTETQK
jgi:hypothetical protein